MKQGHATPPTRTETLARRAALREAKNTRQAQEVAALRDARTRYGIRLEDVAAEAERTTRHPGRTVSAQTVSHVLHGRVVSANILAALKRLIGERRRRDARRRPETAAAVNGRTR